MAAASSFSLLSQLPGEVLSQILSTFCDGRSMSTFGIVARGDRRGNLHQSYFALLRDALVHRYVQLARELRDNDEIRDALDAIREDIRTCEPPDDNDGGSGSGDGHGNAFHKVPEWCAILDYFDGTKDTSEWTVWSGPVGTPFGTFEARVSTPLWTPTALQYWYNELELRQFALVPPRQDPPPPPTDDGDDDNNSSPSSYGRLEGVGGNDSEILRRLAYNLSPDFGSGRYALVPNQMEYEPTLFFTLPMLYEEGGNHPFSRRHPSARQTLACYWDCNDDGYDWEESIERLGENVIRIMDRCYRKQRGRPSPT